MKKTRGFTLIEIAIGMAVLGLGIASALQVFGGAVQLARGAGRRTEAVMHAKALMDSSLWAPEFSKSVSHGEIGNGFRWERNIRPAATEEDIDGELRSDVRLTVVTVELQWDEPSGVKTYQVATMRIEPVYED